MQKRGKFILVLLIFALASIVFAISDSDKDGVPDQYDKCPDSESTVVDVFGCSCEQKTIAGCNGRWCCIDDSDECTDLCGSEGGKAVCNLRNDVNCPKCIDSDVDASYISGQNMYIKGNVTLPYKNNTFTDECVSVNKVLEYYCEQGEKKSTEIDCPNKCVEGRCLMTEEQPCVDSDGGKNYYVRGVLVDKNGQKLTDFCFPNSSSRIIEYSCQSDGLAAATDYTCPNGCKDGACVTVCGNSVCENTETTESCPQDCDTEKILFFVSTTGDDSNPGTSDRPFYSLKAARDAIRKLKQENAFLKPIKVIIGDGTYQLNERLVFEPQDSGTAQYPISYEAAFGAKPIFSGGKKIIGFSDSDGDGIWTASIPEVQQGKWYFNQLFVNDKRAVRARSPNKFYYYILYNKYHTDSVFQARDDDIKPLLSMTQAQLNDVMVITYNSWETSLNTVKEIGTTDLDVHKFNVTNTSMLQLAYSNGYPLLYWGPNQRYHLENFKEALDAPGEWFLDRDGTLYYMPLPGEKMATAEVIAPAVEYFVKFNGQPEQNSFVEYISLKGLSFKYSSILPFAYHLGHQAEANLGAVITADGAQNIKIENCEISHIAMYGIWFKRDCKNNLIQKNYLHDLGGGGIRIGEGAAIVNESEKTGSNVVDNNIINGGGRIFAGAVGIWVGHSPNNRVTHNDISDLYYSGISAGWAWGSYDTLKKLNENNLFEFNHIHNIGQGVLSDMGGIYTLGIAPNTSIRNNLIHDVYSYDKYGWGGVGLYNDEGSNFYTLENNLVYNTKSLAYQCHICYNITLNNNIFAANSVYQLPWLSNNAIFKNNIVYWKTGGLFASSYGNLAVFEKNIYFDASGKPINFMGMNFSQWQASGRDVGSIVANPLFVDPDNYNFNLKVGSPAYGTGFKPFDYTQAGVYGDSSWTDIPKKFNFPPVGYDPNIPPAPPFIAEDVFEFHGINGLPRDARVSVENKGDYIGVTDETGAGGSKKSLKVVDAQNLTAVYNPYFYYLTNYNSGIVHDSFDLRVESGANFLHQWRNTLVSPSYVVGPSIQIVGGKLWTNISIMDIPVSQWVHFDIDSKVGQSADGSWNLTVTLPNQQPQSFQYTSSPLRNVTWVGFISNANNKTVFYLDNIMLRNCNDGACI